MRLVRHMRGHHNKQSRDKARYYALAEKVAKSKKAGKAKQEVEA